MKVIDAAYCANHPSRPKGENNNNDIEDASTLQQPKRSLNGTSGNGTINTDNFATVVGAKETKTISQLRVFVFAVLIVSATCVGTVIFHYIRTSEVTKFEEYYTSDTTKLIEAIGLGVYDTIASLDLLATNIVYHARQQQPPMQWPFVTVPDFAARVAKTRVISKGIGFWFSVIVQPEQRMEWEAYAWDNRNIVNTTLHMMSLDPNYHGETKCDLHFSPEITSDRSNIDYNVTREFCPIWQLYPISCTTEPPFNWDWYYGGNYTPSMQLANTKQHAVIAHTYLNPDPKDPKQMDDAKYWAQIYSPTIDPADNPLEPVSDILYPIIDQIDVFDLKDLKSSTQIYPTVGNIGTTVYWREFLRDKLSNEKNVLHVVIDNACRASFSYQIQGTNANFLGRGDWHDPRFNSMRRSFNLTSITNFIGGVSKYTGLPISEEYCPFTISIYPSTAMEQEYITNRSAVFTAIATMIFVFTSIVFIVYDWKVERRQEVVSTAAARSNAVVSSLFPSKVRQEILETANIGPPTSKKDSNGKTLNSTKLNASNNTNSFLHWKSRNSVTTSDRSLPIEETMLSRPLADLYTETTVLFSDIKGFTAWSSRRDPCAVFTLLEQLYGDFDRAARMRGVFKVETIGDAYVAVTGLPEPMTNHVVTMVRFADDMLTKAREVFSTLSGTLGPDTAQLEIRIGLNSGPTIAGVLRGERARFQLFGDTVNTAARMETNSLPGRIQCSQETARKLILAGKGRWLEQREEMIEAKGKGVLQTFWVRIGVGSASRRSSTTSMSTSSRTEMIGLDSIDSMITWNVKNLLELLFCLQKSRIDVDDNTHPILYDCVRIEPIHMSAGKLVVDFDCDVSRAKVETQLIDFVTKIASMYRKNPFHNFHHANHVVMSVSTLLGKISDTGITSTNHVSIDPLARFSAVFAALIHDVDHQGVTNSQLVREMSPIAIKYQNKSVAEQNSFDMAWSLLMEGDYDDLRRSIYSNDDDKEVFRQYVSNIVIATDIFDKDMKNRRLARWQSSFQIGSSEPRPTINDDAASITNIRAEVVLELLVQVSDVIHTMQHWNIFLRWNRSLFDEAMVAYNSGRGQNDPSVGWYEGEIWFFDNYIIPLVNKVKSCDCLDVDVMLMFANENRQCWEEKGCEIVSNWISESKIEADDSGTLMQSSDDVFQDAWNFSNDIEYAVDFIEKGSI